MIGLRLGIGGFVYPFADGSSVPAPTTTTAAPPPPSPTTTTTLAPTTTTAAPPPPIEFTAFDGFDGCDGLSPGGNAVALYGALGAALGEGTTLYLDSSLTVPASAPFFYPNGSFGTQYTFGEGGVINGTINDACFV